jgi:hypothetical protein
MISALLLDATKNVRFSRQIKCPVFHEYVTKRGGEPWNATKFIFDPDEKARHRVPGALSGANNRTFFVARA